ncbi:jg20710, partial [Pararge aegeria aegeria]
MADVVLSLPHSIRVCEYCAKEIPRCQVAVGRRDSKKFT